MAARVLAVAGERMKKACVSALASLVAIAGVLGTYTLFLGQMEVHN